MKNIVWLLVLALACFLGAFVAGYPYSWILMTICVVIEFYAAKLLLSSENKVY